MAYLKHEENPDAPRIALEFAAGISWPFEASQAAVDAVAGA